MKMALSKTPGGPAGRVPALDRWDVALAMLFGFVALAAYFSTMAHGVLPGDSAEFQVLGNLLGSAHNPGYWVYLLLVKGFILGTQGLSASPADRVTLFSAVMGAVVVAETYLAGRLLSGSKWAGGFGALMLAVCPLFWSQAVIAEVYTTGTAFGGAILALMLAWERSRNNGLLFWAGLLGGLSPGAHGTVALFAPAVAALIALSRPDWKRVWKPALSGAALGAALLVSSFLLVDSNRAYYNLVDGSYLLSRSNFDASLEELQSPVGRFTFLITNRQWSPVMFQDPMKDTFEKGLEYFGEQFEYFSPVTLALVWLGFFSLWKRRALGAFFLLAGLGHHVFIFNYRIGDIWAFYLTWYPFSCALAAAGLSWLAGWFKLRLGKRSVLANALLGAAIFVAGVGPFAGRVHESLGAREFRLEGISFPSNADREGWYAGISDTVAQLPPNSLVFVDWSDTYAYTYAAQIEQDRADLIILEPAPFSVKGGMAQSMVDYAKETAQERPVLATRELDELRQAGMRRYNLVVGPTRMYQYEP